MKPTKQLYVLTGKDPSEWSESQPLGPFESESQAREAIRQNALDGTEGSQQLSPGTLDQWCEQYTVVEVLKSFQPVLDVSIAITLKNVALGKVEDSK